MEVFSSSYINVFSLVILLIVTGNDSAPNKNRDYRDSRAKFYNLISTQNEKNLNSVKEYTVLNSYKVGDGILRDIKNNINVEKMTEDNTKAIIYDTLLEVICNDDISPELGRYKDLIFRAGKKNMNEILTLADENTKVMINDVLRKMICFNGKRKTQSKSPVAWLRHTNHLMADYYENHLDGNDQMENGKSENYIRNRNSYEMSNKHNLQDDHINRKENYNKQYEANNDSDEDSDEDDEDSDEDDDDVNDDLGIDINPRSDVLRSSCWKDARKNCKKACKHAVKDTCDDFMCSKRMKKLFKNKCTNYCKDF